MIEQFLSLLAMQMLITQSGWSLSLILIGTGMITLDFSKLSGCEQFIHCPIHSHCPISTIFLKHHNNWDNVAEQSGALNRAATILNAVDPLDAFDQATGEVIGKLVPTIVLCSRSGRKQWFDASWQRAYNAKHTSYCTW